ncbi:hypothetical protein ANCCEY_01678 [Ancylostoma ceylanicum]|uniref:G-protein coupled receptors family 1 profile domain-containing protein n=1 Tax=Ancylostoma ceylanicum TaxID=53326 RepID=A0A0D6M544_9BILA|nr:hypothetical protein ANCCEY_01678 [Ancylostoma ceylanicum]
MYSYDYVPMLAGWEHYQIFNFYVMTVLHIFVPFAILLILNISIVMLTKRKIHGISWAVTSFIGMPKVTELIRKETMETSKKRRDEVRCATRTMVSITTTTRFYTLASDFISILVAVNSLLRLFVYMLCSPSLREQLVSEFPIFGCCQGRKKVDENDEKLSSCQQTLLLTKPAVV